MSQKKDIIINLVALLLALGLIALVIALLFRVIPKAPNGTTNALATPSETPLATKQRVSFGDKILIGREESGDTNPQFQAAKQSGVQAMAAGNYSLAVAEFNKAVQNYRNAPETRIYLSNAQIGNNQAYTIAVIAPIAANVDSALKMLRGVAQAQDEINKAGGINGIPLKVIIADDEGKKEVAEQVASELAKNQNILAVVGHHSSGPTLAARKVYESEKLVAISSTSTSVQLSQPSTSPKRYVFRTVPSDAFAAKALANYMLSTINKRKAVVFYDPNSAYSLSLKDTFVAEVFQNQGEVVDQFEFSDPNFSASRYLQRAIDRGAEVVMLAAPDDRIQQTLSVINVNDRRLKLLGGDDIYDKRILEEGRSRSEGMVVAMAWHIEANLHSPFVGKSREFWGGDVDWKTAMTYDASQALIAALKISPTRDGVQKALSSPEFQTPGVSDSIRFVSSSGDRVGRVQLVQVQANPNSRSRTGFDFVPLRP